MAYGANILKNEAGYYTLTNATIINGILHIGAGGSATEHLDITDLAQTTSKFLFTCIGVNPFTDNYQPWLQVLVYTKMKKEPTYTQAVLYPVQVDENKYECEFSMLDGEFEEMYVTISSKRAVDIMLWELRPEAADESAQVEIEGVKQALSKLLYDYNTVEFTGSIYETTIALITCKLLQNTDVQGHFLFTFNTTQKCTLTLRFYDNEAEELFSPLFYDLYPGHNSIGVPHAFLHRLAGNHSFFVTAQVNYGTFTVPVRGALFTIDAGYLATREIDLAMDVYDISVRQLKADNGPNEIWAVGIESDILYVQYRSYKETNTNVGWTSVGSLGVSRGAAIEFDGDWVLRTNADQYTIETEEIPYIFNIDGDNNLYAYHGINDTNPVLLDTDVSMVKACKGYSSIDYPDQDQGLIVAYIKNNIAYYRRYYYSSIAGKKLWEDAQAFNGNWDAIDVHRLNDYRASFTLSNAAENLWKYTDRTYVGQAAYPEKFNTTGIYDEDAMFVTLVGYYSTAQVDNSIEIESIGYNLQTNDKGENIVEFVITVNRPLFSTQHYADYSEMITYTGPEDVQDVEWTPYFEHTVIKVRAKMPLKHINYVFTIKQNEWLRYYQNSLVYKVTSDISDNLDLRVYVNAEEETTNTQGITTALIAYRGKENVYVDANDAVTLLGSTSAQSIYQSINRLTESEEDTHTITGTTAAAVNYYHKNVAPV